MEGDAPVDGSPERQDHEQNVGRVEKGRLKASQKRHSREYVRIPQRQPAVPEFPESEVAPEDKLLGEVRSFPGQDDRLGREENIREQGHSDNEQDEEGAYPGMFLKEGAYHHLPVGILVICDK
jgi:hypothetical protein